MPHFTVLVIGDDVEKQLEPFDENIEMPERENGLVSLGDRQNMIEFYLIQDNPKYKKPETQHPARTTWKGDPETYNPLRVVEYISGGGHELKDNPPLDLDSKYHDLFYELESEIERISADNDEFTEIYDTYGDDWNGNTWRYRNGEWVHITTYNPDSKWDWYQIGGRWSGFFRLKEGTTGSLGDGSWANEDKDIPANYVDQARKGDIDFKGMIEDTVKERLERFDKVKKIVNGREVPIWEEIMKKHGENNINDARSEYSGNPIFKDLRDADIHIWGSISDEFANFDRDEFIRRESASAISTYALVKDGKWYQKGEMGRWGMSSDEMKQDEWNLEFAKLLDEASDDTLLTVVDCHI